MRDVFREERIGVSHILLYGPGDLGERIIYQLIPYLKDGDRLTVSGRAGDKLQDIVNMAQMQCRALALPIMVQSQPGELNDRHLWIQWLTHNPPDVVIFTATQLTWWKIPTLSPKQQALLAQTGFGVWLPFQAALLLQFTDILRALPDPPWLVIGPYPDVTAALVKARGLTRVVGFGNVDELALAAGPGDIRLVAHHSVESALFNGKILPPYRLYARQGRQHWEERALSRPFPWPQGTLSHVWTAACAVRTVQAVLSDVPHFVHAPGPLGLPGGYPIVLSRYGLDLALPEVISLDEAIAINQRAAAFDGIEAIDPDGRVWLTPQCRAAVRVIFDVDVDAFGPTVDDWLTLTRYLTTKMEDWSQHGHH